MTNKDCRDNEYINNVAGLFLSDQVMYRREKLGEAVKGTGFVSSNGVAYEYGDMCQLQRLPDGQLPHKSLDYAHWPPGSNLRVSRFLTVLARFDRRAAALSARSSTDLDEESSMFELVEGIENFSDVDEVDDFSAGDD